MESINGAYLSNEHVEQSQLAIEHIEHEIQGNFCGATVVVVFVFVYVSELLEWQMHFQHGNTKNIEHIETKLNTYVRLDKQLCGFWGRNLRRKVQLDEFALGKHFAQFYFSLLSLRISV